MLRTVTLSLLMLVSIGVMLPIASSTHGLRQTCRYHTTAPISRHSRAWWRRHRARRRFRRAAAAAFAQRNAVYRDAAQGDAAHGMPHLSPCRQTKSDPK